MMLVLLSVSMATILAVSYLASRDNSTAISRNIESAITARWAALSALETGVAILETEVDWRTFDPQGMLLWNYPLSGASISLIVADLATGQPPDSRTEHVLLVARATVNGVTQRATATAYVPTVPADATAAVDLAEFAVFGSQKILLTQNATIARWPTAALSTLGPRVRLGIQAIAAGSVELRDNAAAIDSTVYHGPGASGALVLNASGPAIKQVGLLDQIPMPAAPLTNARYPDGNSSSPDLSSNGSATVNTDSRWHNVALSTSAGLLTLRGDLTAVAEGDLNLSTGAGILIDGNVELVVFGNATLDTAFIELTDTATLTLYLGGDLTLTDSYIGEERPDNTRDNTGYAPHINPLRIQIFSINAYDGAGAGTGWAALYSGTTETLRGIHFPADATTGYAAGGNGTILKTTDGGPNWSGLASGTTATLHAIHFPSDTATGYAAGSNGTILQTADGGATWIPDNSGTLNTLRALHFPLSGEVGFAAGDGGTILKSPGRITTGNYTGDGTDNRAISGVGFKPDVVIIKGGDSFRIAVIRTSTMGGDASKLLANSSDLLANNIQSLDADGFEVGTDLKVNQSGRPYFWVAFRAIPGELKLGTYTGTGADDHNISGVGFQPELVYVMGENDSSTWHKSSGMVGDASLRWGNLDMKTNRIQALQPDGFQVGKSSQVNAEDVTYHYAAWKGIAGQMTSGSYTGDGSDNRSIAGLGFAPEYVVVKADSTATGAHRPQSLTGDSTLNFNSSANFANGIQALEADGFQVGTNTKVNQNGVTYWWAAWGDRWTPTVTGTTQNLWAIHFPVDDLTGYAAGDNGTILKTTNGGASWTAQSSGTSNHLRTISFPTDDLTGYAAGHSGTLLKTTDGGANWFTLSSGTASHLRGIHFPVDDTSGYAVGDNGTVLKTTDAGVNWVAMSIPTTQSLTAVHFPVDLATGFVVGWTGTILKFPDGAPSQWQVLGNSVIKASIYAPGVTYTVSGDSALYGRVAADEVTVTGNGAIFFDPRLDERRGYSNSASALFWGSGAMHSEFQTMLPTLDGGSLAAVGDALEIFVLAADNVYGSGPQIVPGDPLGPTDPTPRPVIVQHTITSFGTSLSKWEDPDGLRPQKSNGSLAESDL